MDSFVRCVCGLNTIFGKESRHHYYKIRNKNILMKNIVSYLKNIFDILCKGIAATMESRQPSTGYKPINWAIMISIIPLVKIPDHMKVQYMIIKSNCLKSFDNKLTTCPAEAFVDE